MLTLLMTLFLLLPAACWALQYLINLLRELAKDIDTTSITTKTETRNQNPLSDFPNFFILLFPRSSPQAVQIWWNLTTIFWENPSICYTLQQFLGIQIVKQLSAIPAGTINFNNFTLWHCRAMFHQWEIPTIGSNFTRSTSTHRTCWKVSIS